MASRIASLYAEIGGDVSGLQRAGAQAKSILGDIGKSAQGASRAVGDYSNSANEMNNVQVGVNKSLQAGTAAFYQSITAGKGYAAILGEGANAAKLSTNQMYNMATASGLFTQRQLATASAQEILTKKSYQLSEAVKNGQMTTQQAGRQYASYVKEQEAAIRSTMSFGEKWQETSKVLNSGVKTLGMVSIAAAGVGVAGKALYSIARSGADIEFTATKFDRLSRSVGTVSGVFLNELRGATKGTISDFGLMKQGSDLLQLGLAKDSTEAVRLSRVMTALGMDTGEMTLALANQSKRRLDQLGLSLSAFNKIESKLKDKGLSKEDAFKEAFLQTAEQTVNITGNKADSSIGSFARLEASTANIWDTTKRNMPNQSLGWLFGGDTVSETAEKVSQFMNGVNSLMKGENVIDLSGGLGADSYVRAAKAQDLSNLWSPTKGKASRYNQNEKAVTGMSALQSYTAMAFAYGGGGAGLQTPEQAPVDYESQLTGGLELTQMNREYSGVLGELNEKLAEQTVKYDALNARYGENSQKTQAALSDLTETKGKIDEVNAVQELSQKNYALATLKQKGATSEMQLSYAVASGQISQDAANQQVAQDKLATAYMNGKMTVDQYSKAIQDVSKNIKGLSGYTASSYVDIYITTHNITTTSSKPGKMTIESKHEQVSTPSTSAPLQGGMAAGGYGLSMLDEGQMVSVGEAGEEGVVQTVHGLYVIPAMEWGRMKASGATAKRGYALGGFLGGGSTGGRPGSGGGSGGRQPAGSSTGGRPGGGTGTRTTTNASGGGGDTSSPFTEGSGGSSAPDIAQEISYIITPVLNAVGYAAQAQQMVVSQSLNEVKKTNDLLLQLIAKTASAGEFGREVAVNTVSYK